MAYNTKQKELILSYIKQNADKHLTAEEIAAALKNDGVGKTTVYRHLEKLCADGIVRKYLMSEGNSACYQYAENDGCHSHFHLKCVECGALIHLECKQLCNIEQHISDSHGFIVDSSRTVFYGKCRECAKGEGEKK